VNTIVRAALLPLILTVAACQTAPPLPVAGNGGSGLPSANYPNTTPVAGVRHVALDAAGNAAVEDIVRSALLNPTTAMFATPFAGAEADTLVLVCGTVSASVSGQRYDNVPFVVVLDYAELARTLPGDDAASLARLGTNIGWSGPYIAANADIVEFCRVEAGIILPA
jgi:hypothetical protein